MVVREHTYWEGLSDGSDGGILMGYNWKGEAVRQFYYGGMPGAEATPLEGSAAELPVSEEKLLFLFGKVTGSLRNIERSTTMARQFAKIGIFDNAAGRALLRGYWGEVLNAVKGELQLNGRIVRESLLVEPNGALKAESIWDGAKLKTVKLFGEL